LYIVFTGVVGRDKYSFSKSVKKGFINLLFCGGQLHLLKSFFVLGGPAPSFEKLFRVECEENRIWFESTDRIVGRHKVELFFGLNLCLHVGEREGEREGGRVSESVCVCVCGGGVAATCDFDVLMYI